MAQALTLERILERFLPECTFRDRQNKKLQYAILVAAALPGGTDPDLLDEIAWWQTGDFWQYAPFATVAPISVRPPTRQASQCTRHARTLAQHQDHPAP